MSVRFNDILDAWATRITNLGYTVARIPPKMPKGTYVELRPRTGPIHRMFQASGSWPTYSEPRVDLNIFTVGDTTYKAAYAIWDAIRKDIEYVALDVTGFLEILAVAEPMEEPSPPFMRVFGTFMVRYNDSMPGDA